MLMNNNLICVKVDLQIIIIIKQMRRNMNIYYILKKEIIYLFKIHDDCCVMFQNGILHQEEKKITSFFFRC